MWTRGLVTMLAGLGLVVAGTAAHPPATAAAPVLRQRGGADCANQSTGLIPLTELESGTYEGVSGGLYPDGVNQPPPAYLTAGMARADEVRPRGPDGAGSPDGRIGLLAIGMSNTTQEFGAFTRAARGDRSLNPALTLVDGAQGGMTATMIQHPDDGGRGTQYWDTVDRRLAGARLAREQVQVVWLKEADANPTGSDIAYARTLADELDTIVGVLRDRFPNLKLVYLSSRTYGGYAATPLNPEPYAYASGFAVRWAVEAQMQRYAESGPAAGPWVAWGPYLWADGLTPRADGLTWACADFERDGTHPSSSGEAKVAGLLMDFLKTDQTARPWFLRDAAVSAGP